MAGEGRVTLELLAKNATTREFAAIERDVAHLEGTAATATESFTELARRIETPPSTGGLLERIQDDLNTATADFKAGIASAEDYEVALAQARKEAVALRRQTGTLTGQELKHFTEILDQTAVKQQVATRSSRGLTTALVSLAAQATGASGALGGVARVALLMGTGGVVAGAIAAGVAGATALYNLWTREARENKKAQEELFAAIEEGARAIIPEEVRREQQRQALVRVGNELTQRRTELEARLQAVRQGGAPTLDTEIALESKLEELHQREIDLLVKRAQLRRIAADESTKAFERQRDELALEHQLLGKSEEAQFRLRLETQKLTEAQVDELVALRAKNDERAREIQLADMAATRASTTAIGEARGRARGLAPLQLRGARPEDAATAPPAPVPEGPARGFFEAFSAETFEGISQANDELEHFGETVGSVIAQGLDLQDAFLAAFLAVEEGSASVGKAFGEAIQRGVAQAAAAKGAFFLNEAIAALGTGLLGNPAGFAAAAKYTAAAAGMFVLAKVAAGGVSIGGSAGSASGGAVGRDARSAERERGETRIVLKGSARVLARDPEFVASVAEAFRDALGTRQIIIDTDDIN